jgi:membrane-associated phospholipid phosphatase
LKQLVDDGDRSVEAVAGEDLLPRAFYVNDLLLDDHGMRDAYFEKAKAKCPPGSLVFFDPDNGLEIKSKKKGQKDSNKFLFGTRRWRSAPSGHSFCSSTGASVRARWRGQRSPLTVLRSISRTIAFSGSKDRGFCIS